MAGPVACLDCGLDHQGTQQAQVTDTDTPPDGSAYISTTANHADGACCHRRASRHASFQQQLGIPVLLMLR